MLAFIFTEFFELYFRRSFRYTDTRAIVSATALAAFEPDIFPFTFLFSHKIRSNQAGLISNYLVALQILTWTCLAGFSTLFLKHADSR
jgi:hypothetical protein